MGFLDIEKLSPLVMTEKNKHRGGTWVEIDKTALEGNIAHYKSVSKPALIAPVIKSNAYGHGIDVIAKLLDHNDNVDMICVVSLSEALLLRSIGIKKPLLVLSILDGDLEVAIALDIDLVVYDLETAYLLDRLGAIHNKKARVHVKVDTGLSRLGLLQHDAINFVQTLAQYSFINIHGIFSHFAESESADQTFTNLQIEVFNDVVNHLERMGIFIPLKHSSCSAAVTANNACHFTMVRVGLGIYGLWPSEDNKQMTAENHSHFLLKPVLTWKTRVIQIKEIPENSFVGYDRTHQVGGPTKIAIIPVGYWDGYDRRLSNNGQVLINNALASVVGRVAMNLTMLDVTGIDVATGDEVILLGNYAGVTADDIAQQCGTINYEIVTRINPLVRRIIT